MECWEKREMVMPMDDEKFTITISQTFTAEVREMHTIEPPVYRWSVEILPDVEIQLAQGRSLFHRWMTRLAFGWRWARLESDDPRNHAARELDREIQALKEGAWNRRADTPDQKEDER